MWWANADQLYCVWPFVWGQTLSKDVCDHKLGKYEERAYDQQRIQALDDQHGTLSLHVAMYVAKSYMRNLRNGCEMLAKRCEMV